MKIKQGVRIRYTDAKGTHTGSVLGPTSIPGWWVCFQEGSSPGGLHPTVAENSMTVIPDPAIGVRVSFDFAGESPERRYGRVAGCKRGWPSAIPLWLIALEEPLLLETVSFTTLALTADQFELCAQDDPSGG